MKLVNGPCDPREIDMHVSADADAVFVRPIPFDVQDVYAVTDRFMDNTHVTVATGEYLHTTGTRKNIDAYRQQLGRLGMWRAFKVKRERVH